ncbi:PepSY domain-containing protein [Listeria fleischmannii]
MELERSFNDTVYSVSIENGTNESDVTVNAKDGSVMNVEND